MLCPACGRNIARQVDVCPLCRSPLDPAKAAAFAARPPMMPVPSGFWRRVVAYIIDGALIIFGEGIVFMLIGTVIASIVTSQGQIATSLNVSIFSSGSSATIFYLFTTCLWIVYFAAFECSNFRATPGKLLMQAYVTDLEGNTLSFGRAALRNFLKIFSGILFCFGFIIAAFTQDKQALHDIFTKTLVLKKTNDSTLQFAIGVVLALIAFILMTVGPFGERMPLLYQLRSSIKARELSSPVKGEPSPAPENTAVPQESSSTTASESSSVSTEPAIVISNSASILGRKIDFSTAIAISRNNGIEMEIGLYKEKLRDKTRAAIEAARDLFKSGLPSPDLYLGLKFNTMEGPCSVTDLSSYLIHFRASPGGFVIPGGLPAMEFARAVTSARLREGIALACMRGETKSIVVAMQGSGGAKPGDVTAPYSWNLGFKTDFISAD